MSKTPVPATERLAPSHELVLVPDGDVSSDEAMMRRLDLEEAVPETVKSVPAEVVLPVEFHAMISLDSDCDLLSSLLLSPSSDYNVTFCVVRVLG